MVKVDGAFAYKVHGITSLMCKEYNSARGFAIQTGQLKGKQVIEP